MRAERFGSYSIVDDLSRDVLLVALEIDDAIQPLVPAAAPPRRQLAVVVAAAGAVQRLDERLVRLARRDIVERLDRLKPPARRRRFVFSDRHVDYAPSKNSGSFSPCAQLHVGLLPVRALSGEPPLALHLAVRDGGADVLDLRSQQRLDGALDFRLVGVRRHFEHDRPPIRSRWMDVFSVMSGRRITSVSFIVWLSLWTSTLPRQLLQLLDRGLRRDHPRRVHHVARAHARAGAETARREGCARRCRASRRLHVDQQRLAVGAEPLQQLDCAPSSCSRPP